MQSLYYFLYVDHEPVSLSQLKRLHADGVTADIIEEDVPQKKGWFLF